VRSIRGGYRVNIVPPEADAMVEGLEHDVVAAHCSAAGKATGARFTVTAEEGAVRVHVEGTGGHAAEPEKATNALTALLHALAGMPFAPSEGFEAIRALATLFPHGDTLGMAAGIAMSDPTSGPLTLTFSLLDYGLTGLSGRFDARTPLCATPANTIDVIGPRLLRAGISLGPAVLSPPHHTPCDSAFVRTLLAAYERCTGLPGSCAASGGGSYVHGIDGGVCFGATMPGFESHAHGPDERASVADILTSARIFAEVIVDLCPSRRSLAAA
jgi:succinyl-diaminopimelate desuccinylase